MTDGRSTQPIDEKACFVRKEKDHACADAAVIEKRGLCTRERSG